MTLGTTLKLTIRLPNDQASFSARTVAIVLTQTASMFIGISTSLTNPQSIADLQDYVFEGSVTEAGTKNASLNITQDSPSHFYVPY